MSTINEVKLATNGLIFVTGEKGVGKTSFALGYPTVPKKIAFFNFDEKPLGGIEKSFHSYHTYFHMLADIDIKGAKNKEKADNVMLDKFLADTEDLVKSKNKPELIIIDSAERLLSAFLPFVVKHSKHMKDFAGGGSGKWSARNKIGYAKVFSTAFLAKLREDTGATIILISHLGSKYVKDVAVGKTPMTNEILSQKSVLSVWLMHSEDSPVPNALVLKRIDKKVVTPKGIRQISVLPTKISHESLPSYGEEEHVSVWDIIYHYWDNPVGLRELTGFEQLTSEEFALISDTLTETQKNQLKVASNSNDLGEADSIYLQDTIIANIDKPLPLILKAVKDAFEGQSVSVELIKSIIEDNK